MTYDTLITITFGAYYFYNTYREHMYAKKSQEDHREYMALAAKYQAHLDGCIAEKQREMEKLRPETFNRFKDSDQFPNDPFK